MRRAILVPIGMLLGFGAASATLALGLAVYFASSPALTSQAIVEVASLILGTLQVGSTAQLVGTAAAAVWRMLVTVCFVPVCFVAVIGEAISVRSLLWCGGATAVVAAALPVLLRVARSDAVSSGSSALVLLLVATGCAGGAMYWLVAGSPAHKGTKI